MTTTQKQLFLSIITPILNGEKTIEACLQSVASQTYPHKEHWIVDGISSDKTLKIVKEWQTKHPHIHYISEKDSGIYQAMNRGIDKSRGEWLYFLGCDDVLAEDTVLEKVSSNFSKSYEWLLGDIIVQGFSKSFPRRSNLSWRRFLSCTILHQGCFYKRTLFEQFRYDESLQIASDYKFNLQLVHQHTPHLFLKFTIAIFNVHGKGGRENQTTLKEMNQCRREILPKPEALFFNTLVSMGFYSMQFIKKSISPQMMDTIQIFKQRYLMR
jgi:glycosyltransferase involved in cell wall biosynthesis